jgi:hypothetical protein
MCCVHNLLHAMCCVLCGCRVSRGFSIKQLKFNNQSKLVLRRVNRQMTQDEQSMLVNPGVRCVGLGTLFLTLCFGTSGA